MYPYPYHNNPYFPVVWGYPNFAGIQSPQLLSHHTQTTTPYNLVPHIPTYGNINNAHPNSLQPRQQQVRPPVLRSIEIRQNNNEEHEQNDIPIPEDIVRSMNDLVTQLIQRINVDPPVVETENEENNSRLQIIDLVNHTQLRHFQTEQNLENDNVCSICHNDMDSCVVRILRCSHTFHHDCIDHWFGIASNCPLCRVSIIPSEEEHVV